MVDYQNSLPVVFGFYDEGPYIKIIHEDVQSILEDDVKKNKKMT